MPRIEILNEAPIRKSARITVLKSLMDYPDDSATEFRISVDVDLPEKWNLGLIVGPSGSGKSTVARRLFGEIESLRWDPETSIFDSFDISPTKTADLLSSVGLASVPTWLRPRHLVSGGEGFRADVARIFALARKEKPFVIDEFTSVVDRQVAKAISVCTSKYARKRDLMAVCVACHYDIMDWLQPDWVIDMNDRHFYRRCLQRRPNIELEIAEVSAHKAWLIFKPHHYMTGAQSMGVRAWCAYMDGAPVAYSSYGRLPHPSVKNMMMGSRLVVLPDFQGLGIAHSLENFVAEWLVGEGNRVRNRTAHPGAQAMYAKDPRWRLVHVGRTAISNSTKSTITRGRAQRALGRRVTRAYEYMPTGENGKHNI